MGAGTGIAEDGEFAYRGASLVANVSMTAVTSKAFTGEGACTSLAADTVPAVFACLESTEPTAGS